MGARPSSFRVSCPSAQRPDQRSPIRRSELNLSGASETGLPVFRAGSTLGDAVKIGGNPSAIKVTGLGNDPVVPDKTRLHQRSIERKIASNRCKPRGGSFIGPNRPSGCHGPSLNIIVAGGALPFAKTVAGGRVQYGGNIAGWQVIAGRMVVSRTRKAAVVSAMTCPPRRMTIRCGARSKAGGLARRDGCTGRTSGASDIVLRQSGLAGVHADASIRRTL